MIIRFSAKTAVERTATTKQRTEIVKKNCGAINVTDDFAERGFKEGNGTIGEDAM